MSTDAVTGQTLFHETWDDGSAASRWSAPIGARENQGIAFDGAVDYAFNYSTLNVSPAPGSVGGTTVGVFLETNTTEQTLGDEGESIGILPLGFALPSTNYRIDADLYLFGNGATGGGVATEYATIGTHHQGSSNVPLRFGTNAGDGLAWQANTDGASSSDLIRYEGPGSETSLGGWEDIPNGSIPSIPTGTAASVGIVNQWVELTVTSMAGTVEFAINGFVVDTVNNSAGVFDAGTLLLGQSDPFSSVSVDNASGYSNGAVFDNIVVTAISAPLPGDFNLDGSVNAADYTVWRDTPSDASDYALWVAHYGEGGSPTSVPEPMAWVLVMLGCGALIAPRVLEALRASRTQGLRCGMPR